MRMNSKAISPIIATVMIILLTISAGAIVMRIVVPFVKDNLQDSTECLPYQDYFKFQNIEGSNCIDINRAKISVKAKSLEVNLNSQNNNGLNASVEGFELIFYGEGLLKSVNFNDPAKIPTPGSIKTYQVDEITGQFTKVEVLPKLKSGKLCPLSDSMELKKC